MERSISPGAARTTGMLRLPRLLGGLAAVAIAASLFVPAALAADEATHTGRVVVSTGGDVTIPAGEQADVVVVVDGVARIAGEVQTIVVVEGQAILDGARAETVVAVRSPVDLSGTTRISGDVLTLDAAVTQGVSVEVGGAVRDMAPEIAGFGFMLASAMLLLYLGFGLAAIAAGLLVAALGARQVREAELLMRREPILTIVVAVLGLVIPLLLTGVLLVTVVGAPLGLGIMLGLWPLAAFLGYLVAAIAIGDWILGRLSPAVERTRPYLAAVIGVLVMQVLAIVPILSALASLFGFGAVLLLAWRIVTRGTTGTAPAQGIATTAPAASPG